MADYTEDRPIWTGDSTFSAGSTPFGYFDDDPEFAAHCDSFAKFAANHLGYPVMDVELIDINFYTAFEGALIEYSNQVNQVNIVNNLLNTLGISTGSDGLQDAGLNGALVGQSLGYITKLARSYGTEADSGGNLTYHTASFDIVPRQQVYSIKAAVSSSGFVISETSSIEIKRLFHNPPPAIIRYFDPFVGTGLGSQQLLDSFDFGGMSPSVNFMMMPIHADLLRIQSIEFNDRVRKSHFSFEIHGDDIKIFPVPGLEQGKGSSSPFFASIWFEFLYEEEKAKDSILFGNTAVMHDRISDPSNIPYKFQQYSAINATGRAWVLRYAYATAQEMLGYVRGKYSTVPIPNAEVTLNGDALVTAGQSAKEQLITELKEFLNKMTKEEMMQRQQAENESLNEILAKIPTKIYIG